MPVNPIPFDTIEQCIHDRFDDIANKFPDRLAVTDENLTLSYSELQRATNKLAHRIIGLFGSRPGNVACLIDNNVYQIIAILGILKAGGAYVALDTSFPEERNNFILEDAGCKMLICTESNKTEARNLSQSIVLEYADQWVDEIPAREPQTVVLPSDNAIILYTSGSTGKPKGVLQSHRNMVHFIKRMSEQFCILPSDKVAYYLSVGFSAHALPLLGGLLNACELKTYNLKSGNFFGFSKWLKDSQISFIMMIPSFLRHFLSVQDRKDRYPDLRLLLLGGETLYRSDVEKALEVFGRNTVMVNIYASTEAYIMRSFIIKHDTIITSNIIPIGYAVEGMELAILDDKGNPAQKNTVGEIILRSEYVTEGYWKRPELQKQDFTTDPVNKNIRIFKTSDIGYFLDDDCIIHIGRQDEVVKLRGYRVDFGEIMNILLESKDIREASCVLKKNPQGIDHIIAYVVPSGSDAPDIEHTRSMLSRMLPDYMLPSYIISIDGLPKNDIGKIDHAILPEPEWQTEDSIEKEAPANDTETTLLEIFEKVLKISPIGTNDNFLKIGANSLGLFVACAEVEKKFDIKLDIKAILETPNIKSLAAFINNKLLRS